MYNDNESNRIIPDSSRVPYGSANNYEHSSFIAHDKQAARIRERRRARVKTVSVCGQPFTVFQGVYDTGIDTELMVESVAIRNTETFLEIGCGAGAISILVARHARSGIGVDINPSAVKNAEYNAKSYKAKNLEFKQGDVFQGIEVRFDVIICNPPYNSYRAKDVIYSMFWDTGDAMKQRFFRGAASRLKVGGRLYFGWADFADIDPDFPVRLARENDFELFSVTEQSSQSKKYAFKVLGFRRITSSNMLFRN